MRAAFTLAVVTVSSTCSPADFCVRVDAQATIASVTTITTALTKPLDF
jgi:hypothetical protein